MDQLNPMICYPGGKSRMADLLLSLIPEHCTFVEPFLGSAALFFKKDLADKNVIGDIDPELINFYRVFMDLPRPELMDLLSEVWIPSEDMFYDHRDQLQRCREHGVCLKNPQRAIQFLYVTQFSYGCKGENWGKKRLCKKCDHTRLTYLLNNFEAFQRKLQQAAIISGDYKNTMKRFDAHCTFYYLDPPYFKPTGRVYKFHDIDPQDLHDFLKSIKGKWLLSYDNQPELLDIFSDFDVMVIDHRYTLGKQHGTSDWADVKELLISNYPISRSS